MGAKLGAARYRSVAATWWYQTLTRGLTFTYFTLTLLFFWGSWADVGLLARALGPMQTLAFVALLWAGASILLSAMEVIRARSSGRGLLISRYTRTVWITVLATVAVTTQVLMATPAPDIVYKGF